MIGSPIVVDVTSANYARENFGVIFYTPTPAVRVAALPLLEVFHRNIQKAPWLSADWKVSVDALYSNYPDGYVWRLADPTKGVLPKFLDTPAKVAAWKALQGCESDILRPLLVSDLVAAKKATEDSSANSALWDGVYNAVSAVNQFPSTVVNASLNGIFDTVGANMKNLFTNAKSLAIIGIVATVVGVVIYHRMKK